MIKGYFFDKVYTKNFSKEEGRGTLYSSSGLDLMMTSVLCKNVNCLLIVAFWKLQFKLLFVTSVQPRATVTPNYTESKGQL